LADLALDLYIFNDKTNPDTYDAKKIDVDKAVLTVDDTKDQLEKKVRSLYYNIKSTEDRYNSLKANLDSAELALQTTQINYDAGMAIAADLLTAKLNVEKIKQQMFDLVAQHDNMLLAIDKPWVS